jgi:hypothetical protein
MEETIQCIQTNSTLHIATTTKGEHMNNETQRIMEALMLIYGSDLQAATITVLLKDGDTAVRFITLTIPQRETKE